MKILHLFFLFMLTNSLNAQEIVHLFSKEQPEPGFGIESTKLFGDSFVTSFLIFVEATVPGHYHEFHTEQVLILEGTGTIYLGKKSVEVNAGDFIFIPAGKPHAFEVKKGPVKVLSIQAPGFDGSDRVPYSFD